MSELNSGKIKITNDGNIIMQFSNYHHVIDSDTELYYKHQADKVIADKDKTIADAVQIIKEQEHEIAENDEKIAELKKERDWLAKDRAQAYDDLEKRAQLNIKQEESIRHHKYKRCLGLARGCRLRARWFGDNAFYKKEQYALQWHKRWLELAEKFKDKEA